MNTYIMGQGLAPGDTIAIVAPSAPLAGEELQKSRIFLETLGYHVCTDEIKGEKVKQLWQRLEPSIEMVLIPSPYRQLSSPLVTFIRRLRKAKSPNDVITVLIPEFETKKIWHRLLHNQSGMILRARMLNYVDVVVVTVPFKFTK